MAMREDTMTADDLINGAIESTEKVLDKHEKRESSGETKQAKRGRPKGSTSGKTKKQKEREVEENTQMVAMFLSQIFGDREPASGEPIRWQMDDQTLQFGASLWGQALTANEIKMESPKMLLAIAAFWTIGELVKRRQYFTFQHKIKAGFLWLKSKLKRTKK